MGFLLEGVNSNDETYLEKDFQKLYKRLSSYEKKMLALLLQEYIANR